MSHGFNTIGNKIWHATDNERGKITAHADPSILHMKGTKGVAQIIIPAMMTTDASNGNQNRLAILGISLKKLERSTSLTVADH